MTVRTLSCLLLVAAGGMAPTSAPQKAAAARSGRVVLLSVDAGADWVVDELVGRGKAPAFAAIAREGAMAEAMTTVLPTLTAPAHASLWTGAPPAIHGVTGNRVLVGPRIDHSLLESRSGFESGALRAEPIWITAARAGRRVLVPQATAGAPFANPFPRHLLQFDIYANCSGEIDLVEGRVEAGGPAFTFRIAATDVDIRREANGGLSAHVGDRALSLSATPRRFTDAVPIQIDTRTAMVRMRLLSDDPASGRFVVFRGRVCELTSSDPARLDAFRQAAGTIVGEGVTAFYARGRFGPTLANGGAGDAEREVAEILEANQEYFDGALAFAAREKWDLLVLYLPNFDAVLHALGGMVDESNGGYSDALATRVWPWLERVFQGTVDRFVADLRKRFPDANLLIAADHGIEGASRVYCPNVTLRKAGLLSVADGEIDLSRSTVLHVAGQGGSLFVNTTDSKRGIVLPVDRERVKRQAIAALLAVRDPLNGAAPVRAIFDREIDGAALGFGGDGAPDLIFDLASGYETTTAFSGDEEIRAGPPTGLGDHGGAPWHRNLRAIFYAVGPSVRPGTRLGAIDIVDVAPTVARLLGIPAPPNSTGRPLPLQ